jgi:hypothetical protein
MLVAGKGTSATGAGRASATKALRPVSVDALAVNASCSNAALWTQRRRRLALMPCDIATAAIETPGCRLAATTCALNSSLWRRRCRPAIATPWLVSTCHIGDRESDIYELFCRAREAGDHFVFRTCADRLAGDGRCTVAQYMERVRCQGLHRLQVRDGKGNCRQAVVELRYCLVPILPPRAKQSRYPPLTLTVLHASERDPPKGIEPIDWKLITDLPVRCRQEAIDKLQWYAMRWKIETFHKILKSGCRAEESHLRTAQRLTNLIALMCILSWRIFWLTMMNRVAPDAPATWS